MSRRSSSSWRARGWWSSRRAEQAQRITGTDRIHAVIGRCHLVNAKPEIVQRTVSNIKAMKPDHVVPSHCSRFETLMASSWELQDELTLSTAGTEYRFSA